MLITLTALWWWVRRSLEEEGARRSEAQRALKEALSQVSELKEEVENERLSKERAEKQKRDMSEELEALKTELEDTLDTTATQQELRSVMSPKLKIRVKTERSLTIIHFH